MVPAVVRARTPERLPVVLSREEIGVLLKQLTGTMRLMVMLLYGTGVQIEECVDLRVKDLDFDRHQIIVRQGKGRTDRLVDVMWIFTRVDTRESGAYPPDPRSSGVGWKCGLRKR